MWVFLKWVIKIALYSGIGWFMSTDSKNRDVSGFLWVIAAFFLCFWGFFGLPIYIVLPAFIILYLLLRPKGELIYCTECFKKKLIDKPYCPHCFHIDETVLEEENENNEEEISSCCSCSESCSDNSDEINNNSSENESSEKKENTEASESVTETSDNKEENKNSLA